MTVFSFEPADAPDDDGSTEATDSEDDGGFAFPVADVVAYYEGAGYACDGPRASTQAAGWTSIRCVRLDASTGFTHVVGLVADARGVLGDGFSGVVGSAGAAMPSASDVALPLGGFLGAMLGPADGTEAFRWASAHFGEGSARASVGEMLIGTYTEDDVNGVGIYVEVASPVYLAAPAP